MPSTQLRQNVLMPSRRLVVKLGTQLLTAQRSGQAGLDVAYLQHMADQIAGLKKQGYEITLVSSGAIGAGCVELGVTSRPTDVVDLQAIAAIGQRGLMMHMHEAFAKHSLPVAQLLLTRDDFDNRSRYLNFRNCVNRLHQMGAVPILNENDTVATEEIRFGDNDMLAALACNALRADALVLLTVVDGLLDEQGERVDLVTQMDNPATLTRAEKSSWGTGGMATKLEAARIVTEAGELAIIANGRTPNIVPQLMAGEKLGTLFMPAQRKLDSRKRWIGLTARPTGHVKINARAAKALCEDGRSLLAVGIVGVEGTFAAGDILLVVDESDREIARGLVNYNRNELDLIQGKQSSTFEALLGRPAFSEVIHRDNLVVLSGASA